MSIFPDETDDEIEFFIPDQDIDQDEDVQPPVPYGTSWKFDHSAGDIYLSEAGETLHMEGIETVKEWIRHTLSIRRFESPVYGTDIGTDLFRLIGTKDSQFVLARMRQEIEGALKAHDRITAVEVTKVFTIGEDAYALVEFETDDSDREDLVVTLG